jgi:iron complex outermembrane recepter protein
MTMNRKIWMASTALALTFTTPVFAQGNDAAPQGAEEQAELTVIGSRGKARTDIDRPVPVDVVSTEELKATGQTDLGQQVQFTSPSFNPIRCCS